MNDCPLCELVKDLRRHLERGTVPDRADFVRWLAEIGRPENSAQAEAQRGGARIQ